MEFNETGAERSTLESVTGICLRKPRHKVYQQSLCVNIHDRVCGSLTIMIITVIYVTNLWQLLLLSYFMTIVTVSQIRYLLVVILELNGVSEVQYKGVMMIDDGKYQ